jgi:hypothetical protein
VATEQADPFRRGGAVPFYNCICIESLSRCRDVSTQVELLEPRSANGHHGFAPRAPSPALGYTLQVRPLICSPPEIRGNSWRRANALPFSSEIDSPVEARNSNRVKQ